jgi:hypothetical protein
MRWLLAIAFILGTWSIAAILLVDYLNAVGPPRSALSTELCRRKTERVHEFYGKGLTAAAACLGLATLIGLGKRGLAFKSMARNSGADVSAEADLSQPP